MKKLLTFGVITLLNVTTLTACRGGGVSNSSSMSGGGKASGGRVLRATEQQEIPTADLSLATDRISLITLSNVYGGIYRLDKDNKVQPAHATEKTEVSEDGLAYETKLNRGAKWSDGKPVAVDDYVYGWQRIVDPAIAPEYTYLYAPVKNGGAIAKGEEDKPELGIKAVSDTELEITLGKATSYLDYLLAFPSLFLQHQDVVEKYGEDYASDSEGTVHNGPLVLDGSDGPGIDTKWLLRKNGQYWDRDIVKLDSVNVNVMKESSTTLNLFQDGQADDVVLSGELAQQVASDPAFVSQKEASTQYTELNQRDEKSPFRNANLHKVISYSIDCKALVESTLGDGSIEPNGLIPTDAVKGPSGGKDLAKGAGSQIEYDTKKVKEYREKTKKELGISTLTMDIPSSDVDSSKKTIEFAQGSIQDALDGMRVMASSVPFSVRLDRSNKGDLDTAVGGWNADYADPSSFLDLFASDNLYNRGRYNNAEFDKLVKAASSVGMTSPEKRWGDVLNAEKTIMGGMDVVPLFQKSETHLHVEKVEDVAVYPAGAAHDYRWTYVSE